MNGDWMSNVNVRLALYVSLAMMPNIIADLSASNVTWATGAVVLFNALIAAKAFMSDPKNPPPLPEEPPKPTP